MSDKQIIVRGTLLSEMAAIEFLSRSDITPTQREWESVFSDGAVRPKKSLDAALRMRGVDTTGMSYRRLQQAFIQAREEISCQGAAEFGREFGSRMNWLGTARLSETRGRTTSVE